MRPAKYSIQPELDKLSISVKRLEAEATKLLHAQTIDMKVNLDSMTRNQESEISKQFKCLVYADISKRSDATNGSKYAI